MDTKRLGHVEIKDEAKGEFSAVIATYGVVDKDGDVTVPGAHKDGQRVVVSPYEHSSMGANSRSAPRASRSSRTARSSRATTSWTSPRAARRSSP